MSWIPGLDAQLAGIRRQFWAALENTEQYLMGKMDDISAAVAALKTDFEAYKTGVDQALADAKANATDPAAIDAVIAQVQAVDQEIKDSGAVASAAPAVAAAAAPDTGG